MQYAVDKLRGHVEDPEGAGKLDDTTEPNLKEVCVFLKNFVLGALQSQFTEGMLELVANYLDVVSDAWFAPRIRKAIYN